MNTKTTASTGPVEQRVGQGKQPNSSQQAPERIYGWLNDQRSIARHFGGLEQFGHRYVIAYQEKYQPLVRVDVLAREAKEAKEKQRATDAQKGLI